MAFDLDDEELEFTRKANEKLKRAIIAREKLIELNFNVISLGFDFWIEAIEYTQGIKKFDMEDIYRFLAKENKTTRDKVERAMRISLYTAKKTIMEKTGYKQPLTTKVVLRMLNLRII